MKHPFDKLEAGTPIAFMNEEEISFFNKAEKISKKIKSILDTITRRKQMVWTQISIAFNTSNFTDFCVRNNKVYGGKAEDINQDKLDSCTLLGEVPSDCKNFFLRGKKIAPIMGRFSRLESSYRTLMWGKIERRLGYMGDCHIDPITTQIKKGNSMDVPGAMEKALETMAAELPPHLKSLYEALKKRKNQGDGEDNPEF